jgi:hypothetical protein
MNISHWVARDWRKLLAMILLSGGGIAMTATVWRLIGLVAERSINDPWPLAYSMYGSLALIGLVLVSLGWVIGKAAVSGEVAGAKFEASGGDDSGAVAPATVTATATVTQP